MPPPLPWSRPPRPPDLNLVTYNIWDGRGFAPPQAIRAVHIANYNLMLMTEMKIPDETYFQNHLGYNNMCSQVAGTEAGGAQGGVGLVVRERPEGWSVESMHFHGTNMVICEIFSSGQQTLIIRAYLPLFILDHLLDIEEAIK